MNTVSICYISNNIFQEIKYIDTNDLNEKLKLLILYYDCDSFIQLMLYENFLNDFDIIDNLILSKLASDDIITIVFVQKKNYIA